MADDSREATEVSERSSPSGKIVYKAVLKEADEELSRPSSALFWSGLAAGLSMGFSLVAEGALWQHLPNVRWTTLVARLGYSVGFVVVILGRQQLFTENTLTPILPLLKRKDLHTLMNVLRLWGVVLTANLMGALVMAYMTARSVAFEPALREQFIDMGREAIKFGFSEQLLRGIFAGWLVALLVWMLPYAESSHFFVIILITWLIGAASFSHVIAGAVEVFTLGWAGARGWFDIVAGYIVPVLLGNIFGGVTLVAAVNHAQVMAGKD